VKFVLQESIKIRTTQHQQYAAVARRVVTLLILTQPQQSTMISPTVNFVSLEKPSNQKPLLALIARLDITKIKIRNHLLPVRHASLGVTRLRPLSHVLTAFVGHTKR